MRGDISHLVKIITTMKVASCTGMPYAPALCFAWTRAHPHFLERKREKLRHREDGKTWLVIEQGCEPGSKLQSTLNHWVSVSPQAAWQLAPQALPHSN